MVRVGSSALFCRKKLRTLVLFEQSLRLLLDQRCLLGIWPRFLAGQKPSRISFVRRSSDCCLHLSVHRQGRKGRASAVLGTTQLGTRRWRQQWRLACRLRQARGSRSAMECRHSRVIMIGFHPLLRRLRHGGAAILWSRAAPFSARATRCARTHLSYQRTA